MSAISRIPALAVCTESPSPGAITTSVESASPAISTSAWPTPTVSTQITPNPAASSTRSAAGAAADSPPRWPRLAIDRMNTAGIGGVGAHPDPVTEQRAAGERRGRVDREHGHPLPGRPERSHQPIGDRRLAHAGRAGQPDHASLAGVRGRCAQHCLQYRPRLARPSRSAGRATGRRRPAPQRPAARLRGLAPASGRRHGQQQRVALPAAAAQGRRAKPAAASPELVDQGQREPGS